MKKLAIGCLIVVVVGAAAVVGIGYYGYLKVRSTVTQLAELRHIPEIERDIKIKTPFVAPASGEMSAAQLERFMQVETRIHDRLGQNFERLQRTYKTLADRANKDQTNVTDLPQLMAAYRDMAAAWLDAKRTQIDALNDAKMSLDEFRWLRSESYRALKIPFVDLDWGRMAEQVKAGASAGEAVVIGGALGGPAPESNAKLVEKYRHQLEVYLPMAAFGL